MSRRWCEQQPQRLESPLWFLWNWKFKFIQIILKRCRSTSKVNLLFVNKLVFLPISWKKVRSGVHSIFRGPRTRKYDVLHLQIWNRLFVCVFVDIRSKDIVLLTTVDSLKQSTRMDILAQSMCAFGRLQRIQIYVRLIMVIVKVKLRKLILCF